MPLRPGAQALPWRDASPFLTRSSWGHSRSCPNDHPTIHNRISRVSRRGMHSDKHQQTSSRGIWLSDAAAVEGPPVPVPVRNTSVLPCRHCRHTRAVARSLYKVMPVLSLVFNNATHVLAFRVTCSSQVPDNMHVASRHYVQGIAGFYIPIPKGALT